MKYIIYALHHDSSPRVYVGKSTCGLARPNQHKKPSALKKNWFVSKWVKKLIKNGCMYEIAVLEEHMSLDGLAEAEQFYISTFRGLGIPLLNLTDGGEGSVGYKHSEETRSKMRKKHVLSPEELARRKVARVGVKNPFFGKKHSPVSRQKMSMARAGRPLSAEHVENIAASRRGKPLSAQHRANILAGQIRNGMSRTTWVGRKHSSETRTKMSESARALPQSVHEARIARLVALNKSRTGQPLSVETRNKISEANKKKK